MQEALPEWTKIIDKLIEETKSERKKIDPSKRYFYEIPQEPKLLIEEECTKNRDIK